MKISWSFVNSQPEKSLSQLLSVNGISRFSWKICHGFLNNNPIKAKFGRKVFRYRNLTTVNFWSIDIFKLKWWGFKNNLPNNFQEFVTFSPIYSTRIWKSHLHTVIVIKIFQVKLWTKGVYFLAKTSQNYLNILRKIKLKWYKIFHIFHILTFVAYSYCCDI